MTAEHNVTTIFFSNASVSVLTSRSIKPFSQQAYPVQTAGTTPIPGERDHRLIIISVLETERAVLWLPLGPQVLSGGWWRVGIV